MKRIKRILLVRSAIRSSVSAGFLPLGLLYLSSVLRERHPDIEIKIVDLFLGLPEPAEVLAEAVAFAPDLVGVSSFNVDAATAHRLAAGIKRAMPEVPVVFGGPYASCSWRVILRDPNVDVAAIGEGEETFADLVCTLDRNGDLAEVRGIAVRGPDGEPIQNPERPFIEDLDAIPFPAWDLVNVSDYDFTQTNQYLWVERRNAPIFTSRGCPFRCDYCHHVHGKRFRARSTDNVLRELRARHDRHGVRDVLVQDDIFNLDLERAKAICDAIVDSGMKFNFSFPNGLRGEIVDDQLIGKLQAINTIFVAFAIETASEQRNKALGRRGDIKRVAETIRKTSAAGIFTHCYFMIGFEDETRQEMEATIDLACSLPLNSMSLSIVNRYDLADSEVSAGPGSEHPWDRITGSDYQTPGLQRSQVPDDELLAIRRRGYRRFYADPQRLMRIIRQTPNRAQLLYKGWLAVRYALR